MIAEGSAHTAEQGLQAAERIGFPVMIKASGGGGGKGIRKSESSDDFVAKFRAVQSEFPGSPVFVMKMATKTRHIEVQILADQQGLCKKIRLSSRSPRTSLLSFLQSINNSIFVVLLNFQILTQL